MNIIEAYNAAKDGDKITDPFGNFFIKGGTDDTFSVSAVVADVWEIEKKEDEPITAEEYFTTEISVYFQQKGRVFEITQEDFRNLVTETYEAGEKNDELKYKKLVDELVKGTTYGSFSESEKDYCRRLLKLIKCKTT